MSGCLLTVGLAAVGLRQRAASAGSFLAGVLSPRHMPASLGPMPLVVFGLFHTGELGDD